MLEVVAPPMDDGVDPHACRVNGQQHSHVPRRPSVAIFLSQRHDNSDDLPMQIHGNCDYLDF